MSKLEVPYAYHRGTVTPSQVGTFAYVNSLAPENKVCIICINLVLPMMWVESPKFFCTFSLMLIDVANALILVFKTGSHSRIQPWI